MIVKILIISIVSISLIYLVACTGGITTAPDASTDAPANIFSNTGSGETSTTTNPVGNPAESIFNVDDIARSPERFTGQIIVEGVVSSVTPEQDTIGLIDSREYASCKVVTCSSFILPVQWSGFMPQVEDKVQITGSIEKFGEKYIFVANRLENSIP